MARGQKYDNETKEKALAMLATDNNVAEIAKQIGIPERTLRDWKKEKEDDEEFAELRRKKKTEFVNKSWEVIEKALLLGKKRVERALNHEEELDNLIDEISADSEIHPLTKQALVSKIKTLQIQTVRDISTFIGTLYDKQALASGEANNKTELAGPNNGPLVLKIELPEK